MRKEYHGTITLEGKPMSTNSIYKYHRRGGYITSKGRALKESYQWQAKAQWNGKPLTGTLSVAIHIYFGNKSIHDWDNYHKLSMDALNGIVWKDDKQIRHAEVLLNQDKEHPRIEVEVYTI